ncbi:MAG: hypothetical protein EAZ95_09210 [Bacteroidetes bacterium]|nr:MAG: hypothetical protein EAZ95_09210 [Bacteroidota bacterium]
MVLPLTNNKSMETIHSNADLSAQTTADRELKYYHIFASGSVKSEDFKGGFNAVLEDMKANGYNRIVLDLKKVTSTNMSDRAWLVSSYLPELYKAGKNIKIGVINSDSWIEGGTIRLLVTSIQALGFDLGITFFKSVEEAKEKLLVKE